MRRILVAGSTGAGKTTLARALAEALSIPFHEMDALAITGPDWEQNPELHKTMSQISATPAWVIDSLGYPSVRDLLWMHADTVVWLDYSRPLVMRRVLRRSAARTLTRRRVFGGNVETLGGWLSADHPAWWSWSQFTARRAEILARSTDPRFAPLDIVRLRNPTAAQAWLADTTRQAQKV